MKEITKSIQSLSDDRAKELAALLDMKSKSRSNLTKQITSLPGFISLLFKLSDEELKILKTVYSQKGGLTFGEIEKESNVKTQSIAKASDNLAKYCLIYILKNRQLINNKLDKAYGFQEIAELLHISSESDIKSYLKETISNLKVSAQKPVKIRKEFNDKILSLCSIIIDSGCAITLGKAQKLIDKQFDSILEESLTKGILHIYYVFEPKFQIYLVIDKNVAPEVAHHLSQKKKTSTNVNNRLLFLNNMLNTYDIISTYGLFLTKQMEFRKIDIRRIEDSLFQIKDCNGEILSNTYISQLTLYLLNKLKCLQLHKDIAHISLTEIKKEIEHPVKLLGKTVNVFKEHNGKNNHFIPPYQLPEYEFLFLIIDLLDTMKTISMPYLKIITEALMISKKDKKSVEEGIDNIDAFSEEFNRAMDLLSIFGIIAVEKGAITLSDMGNEILNIKSKQHKSAGKEDKVSASIYINPDFTLVIPVDDISSEDLYLILSHIDIIKHDVIIHGQISKMSVVRARKRGMALKCFLDALKKNAKNDLPQNMEFLINEWTQQTIDLTITNAILLKSTHPSFIDELQVGRLKESIIERVSNNYALIKKEYIDDIVKVGNKKDAVITLFSHLDDED